MHDGRWSDGWGSGGGWWMVLVMIAVVAAVAWVIVMVLRRGKHEHSHPVAGRASAAPEVVRPTPQDILAERLARGEIETEEYSKSLAALVSSPPPS